MSENEVIVMDGIKKVYYMGANQVIALKGINMTIKKGEMVAIMGHSGSGKSTLLNIIGCLDRPTEGSYYLNGDNVSKLSNDQLAYIRNKGIGFVFQSFNLLDRASVLDNVRLPLVYSAYSKKEITARAREALEWVGMSEYWQHHPGQMSGGQRQRIAIARALINEPSLILADEPTGALDSKTGVEIVSVMQKLNLEKGITVVIVTHNKDLSLYARRLITIRDGLIVDDTPIANPRNAGADLAAWVEHKEA